MDRERYVPKRLDRSRTDRMVAGVAGGLAHYFDIDPVLVRLIWAVSVVLSGGMTFAVYVILWIVVPSADRYEENGAAARPTNGRRSDVIRENVDEMQAEFRRLATDVEQTFRPRPKTTTNAEPAQAAAEPEGAAPTVDPITGEVEPRERVRYEPERVPYEPVHDWGEARRRRQIWTGTILVVIGLFFLLNNLNLFWWFNMRQLWPLILIGVGALLLWSRTR